MRCFGVGRAKRNVLGADYPQIALVVGGMLWEWRDAAPAEELQKGCALPQVDDLESAILNEHPGVYGKTEDRLVELDRSRQVEDGKRTVMEMDTCWPGASTPLAGLMLVT